MSWTNPRTWVVSEVVTASLLNTHVKDNLAYLFTRPNNNILRDNGANYTTTSSSFVDIDGTNLTITIAPQSTKILLLLVGSATADTAGAGIAFDFVMDGTRIGASFTRGLMRIHVRTVNDLVPLCLATIVTVSAGSHTFKPQWHTDAGTAIFGAGGPVDTGIFFGAIELA